jgi:hypothetical protein
MFVFFSAALTTEIRVDRRDLTSASPHILFDQLIRAGALSLPRTHDSAIKTLDSSKMGVKRGRVLPMDLWLRGPVHPLQSTLPCTLTTSPEALSQVSFFSQASSSHSRNLRRGELPSPSRREGNSRGNQRAAYSVIVHHLQLLSAQPPQHTRQPLSPRRFWTL